jgi:hypothetical protein
MTPHLQKKYAQFQEKVADGVGSVLSMSIIKKDNSVTAQEIVDKANEVRKDIEIYAKDNFEYEELLELITHLELKNLERMRNENRRGN